MAANLNQALDRSRFFSWTPGPSILLDTQLGPSYFIKFVMLQLYCCCSVANSCPTLCDPWAAAHQTSLSSTISWSLLKFMSIELVMLSSRLILCHPHLLLPSIFTSIQVFSSESALHIRWPKYWSFCFSISPSNVDFLFRSLFHLRLTGLTSLQSKGSSRVFFSTTTQKREFFSAQLSLWSNSHICTWLLEKL